MPDEIKTPVLERTLPSDWYHSAEIFALERERIFSRDWVCAGRDSEIPNPGDFMVREIAGENLLLLRNAEGQLRGFYNVCRHRGAELCGPAIPGNAVPGGVVGGKRIRCPYHSWVYSLDGDLVSAPHLAGLAGFDAADYALYPVGIESWGGFVFVNLSPDRAPLLETLGAMPARVARYPLASLGTARTIRYEIQANWKVLCENYNECYHCGVVHPELCELIPAFRQNGGADLPWERGVPHREGAYTLTPSGTTSRLPFPDLDDDEKTRHKGELVYPNLFLSLACDHAAAFILQPTGPCSTRIDCSFLFAPEEMARPGFDPSDAIGFWDLVNCQDWAICESVQRGIRSRPHRHGFYAPMEDWNLDIRRYVETRLRPVLAESVG